jgi:hypothetical protein
MKPVPAAESDATGLPGLKRWRSVYVVVAPIFVGWIALLTALTWYYS